MASKGGGKIGGGGTYVTAKEFVALNQIAEEIGLSGSVKHMTPEDQDRVLQRFMTEHIDQENPGSKTAKSAAQEITQRLINDPFSDDTVFNHYNELKGVKYSKKLWIEGFKQTRAKVLDLQQQYTIQYSKAFALADKASSQLKKGDTVSWKKFSKESDQTMNQANKVLTQFKQNMGFLVLAAERTGMTEKI